VIISTEDPFGDPPKAEKMAAMLGGKPRRSTPAHWWALEKPDEGAKVINDFVNAL